MTPGEEAEFSSALEAFAAQPGFDTWARLRMASECVEPPARGGICLLGNMIGSLTTERDRKAAIADTLLELKRIEAATPKEHNVTVMKDSPGSIIGRGNANAPGAGAAASTGAGAVQMTGRSGGGLSHLLSGAMRMAAIAVGFGLFGASLIWLPGWKAKAVSGAAALGIVVLFLTKIIRWWKFAASGLFGAAAAHGLYFHTGWFPVPEQSSPYVMLGMDASSPYVPITAIIAGVAIAVAGMRMAP